MPESLREEISYFSRHIEGTAVAFNISNLYDLRSYDLQANKEGHLKLILSILLSIGVMVLAIVLYVRTRKRSMMQVWIKSSN